MTNKRQKTLTLEKKSWSTSSRDPKMKSNSCDINEWLNGLLLDVVTGSVHLQSPQLTEPLAARLALVRLLLVVDELVVTEVVLPAERLAARVAVVRTFVGVRSLVDHEVVGLGEVAGAVLADELFLCAFCAVAATGLILRV